MLVQEQNGFAGVFGDSRGIDARSLRKSALEDGDLDSLADLARVLSEERADIAQQMTVLSMPSQEVLARISNCTGRTSTTMCSHILAVREENGIERLHLVEEPHYRWKEHEEGITTVCGSKLGYQLQPKLHMYPAKRGQWHSGLDDNSFAGNPPLNYCAGCAVHAERFWETKQETPGWSYDVFGPQEMKVIHGRVAALIADDLQDDGATICKVSWANVLTDIAATMLSEDGAYALRGATIGSTAYDQLLKYANNSPEILHSAMDYQDWFSALYDWVIKSLDGWDDFPALERAIANACKKAITSYLVSTVDL
jgi:hypothetical protein